MTKTALHVPLKLNEFCIIEDSLQWIDVIHWIKNVNLWVTARKWHSCFLPSEINIFEPEILLKEWKDKIVKLTQFFLL